MKLVHWLVTAPLVLVLIVFAVSNREAVTVTLWPFPLLIETRLYLVVLLTLLLGFLVGLGAGWVASWQVRRAARQRARRIEALERDLAAAEARLRSASASSAPPD